VHLDINKVIYSPTNSQFSCLKNNIKIYIKIAPTCFGAITPCTGSSLSVLASTDNKFPEDALNILKHTKFFDLFKEAF